MKRADRRDASRLLHRLVDAAEHGEVEADTPSARRLLRRLEGAASALEVADRLDGALDGSETAADA